VGGRTSETNLVSIVLIPFNLLIVLAEVCSCLEFDLTLCVIPSV
jgi:multisubunit Na+/H+ antiporter MnhB subunit